MRRIAIILALGVLFSSSAHATIVTTSVGFDLYGVNYPGIQTHVVFSYDGIDTATITLENTSSINSILTAFAFNIPEQITGINYDESTYTDLTPGSWAFTLADDGIGTPQPFGLFDAGAYTIPKFYGGDPKEGIYEGEQATFKFTFLGTDLGSLNALSFLMEESFAGKSNDYPVNFIARYQGVGTGREGSDVGVVVPEPSTFLLLGMGIAGVAFLSRRKKNS